MPPKRKRAANDAAASKTTRSTRSSSKMKALAADVHDGDSSVGSGSPEVAVQEPAPKRQRKTTTKASPKKNTSTSATINGDDAHEPVVAASGDTGISKPTKSSSKDKSVNSTNSEPYSPSRLPILFAEYADEDDKDVIGPEGFERLCNDAGISLEGALPLILAWQLGTSEMAKVKKGEWDKSLAELRISSLPTLSTALHDLDKLLILDKPPFKTSQSVTSKKNTFAEPYSRSRYFQYAADVKKAFSDFYMFLFMLTKPPQSRNIDMETACAFWSVVLVPRYPVASEIVTFINDRATYKAVTKDLWSMMLEFCRTIFPDLSNYETDGAWPSLLDDFVSTKKSKADSASANTVADQ